MSKIVKTNSKKNNGISLGYNKFRASSTLISAILKDDFVLPDKLLNNKGEYKLMSEQKTYLHNYWKEKKIEPNSILETLIAYPIFEEFIKDKKDNTLYTLSRTEDFAHSGKEKNTGLHSYLHVINQYCNYRLFVYEDNNIESKELPSIYSLFSLDAVKKWRLWIDELKYAIISQKILVACLSAFISWLKKYSSIT